METFLKFMIAEKIIGVVVFILCTYVLLCVNICCKNGIVDSIVDDEYKFRLKDFYLIPGIVAIKISEYFD